jgi:hypothetical protein
MSNMSYCRFENTARDFADCAGKIEELIAGEGPKLSRSELLHARTLVSEALALVEQVAEYAGIPVEDLTENDVDAAVAQMQEDAPAEGSES